MFGQGPGAGSGEGAKSMSKSTSNAFVQNQQNNKSKCIFVTRIIPSECFWFTRLKPVAEWAQAQSYWVDPTQCQSALMLFDVDIFMLPYSGSAGCIPDSIQKRCIQQDIFRSSSKTPPQDASIFFNIFSLFFNAHLQYALIVLEFGGATFRRASWTSSTFSVTRQPLAWTVLRGLAILGPACKRLFGRDQGQSDLSGVEAGHWSVRRWRGKDQIFHINSPSPLVTTSSSTSHISCFCPNTVWGENGRSKSSLPLEDQVE